MALTKEQAIIAIRLRSRASDEEGAGGDEEYGTPPAAEVPQETGVGMLQEAGKGAVRGPASAGKALLTGALVPPLFRRGAEALIDRFAPGNGVFDPSPAGPMERAAGTGAEIASGAAVAGAGAIPAAISATGGVIGEAAYGEKGKLIGSIAAPLASKPIVMLSKLLGKTIADIWRLIPSLGGESGVKTLLGRYFNGKIGRRDLEEVITRLETGVDHVPGSKTTAGEMVADMPGGSPIVSQQKISAKQGSGSSADFGRQKIDRAAAIDDYKGVIESKAAPLREAAIRDATATNVGFALNGVKAEGITRKIVRMLDEPGVQGTPLAERTLKAVMRQIESKTNADGVIHPETLWSIRNGVGMTIEGLLKGKQNIGKAKGMTANLERKIQLRIDAAIRAGGGGSNWTKWLSDYRKGYKKIRAEEARTEAYKTPGQKTDIGGGVKIGEETRIHIPQLLSRPAMIANFIASVIGKQAEPLIDEVASKLLRDPKALAKVMRQATNEQQRNALYHAILERGGGYTAAAVGGGIAADGSP